MFSFLLWCILLVLCWPLALLALVLYPLVWLLLLPFRLVGIAVEGGFALLRALILLPARALGGADRGPGRPAAAPPGSVPAPGARDGRRCAQQPTDAGYGHNAPRARGAT